MNERKEKKKKTHQMKMIGTFGISVAESFILTVLSMKRITCDFPLWNLLHIKMIKCNYLNCVDISMAQRNEMKRNKIKYIQNG